MCSVEMWECVVCGDMGVCGDVGVWRCAVVFCRENGLDNKVTLVKGAMEEVQLPVEKVSVPVLVFCAIIA